MQSKKVCSVCCYSDKKLEYPKLSDKQRKRLARIAYSLLLTVLVIVSVATVLLYRETHKPLHLFVNPNKKSKLITATPTLQRTLKWGKTAVITPAPLTTQELLERLVVKHLPNASVTLSEASFRSMFEEYFQVLQTQNVTIDMAYEETRLETLIRNHVKNWSFFQMLRLKRAVDLYRPHMYQWLQEKLPRT